ncbi:cytochrome P450 [Pyxidicoccus xibeiensis]|uniref:cytochrome P450 n=1 Tax=Pyxidicoccus xibeiensis TaxID=2906759 RepID=UPI0020A6E062|nr:cytochrome P450 [Pyxidicoccus xibeiensis]MCP3142405.1 cytochrome P450 [Pyxidicoccus xibeiensis]
MDTPVTTPPLRPVAGPRGLPKLGLFFPMIEEPLALANRLHAEYGDSVVFPVYGSPLTFLRNPVDVKRVLIDEPAAFPKPRIVNPFNGNGLTVSRGDFWKRQRHMVQPLFHKEKVKLWAGIFTDEMRKAVERWRGMGARGETFDMYHEAARMMFGVMWRTCFDEQPSEEQFLGIMRAIEVFGKRPSPWHQLVYALVPRLNPLGRRVDASVAQVNEWIYGRLANRRMRGTQEGDITLLSMLVEARARESGENMDDVQVRDEIVNLFGASFEMIATSVTWAVHACTQYPDVVRNIRDELRGAVGNAEPTLEDVPKLPYTARVVQEVNRLCPPAFAILREAKEAIQVGDIMVPKKSHILMFPYAIHRHPDYWTSAEQFDPDRFLPERLSGMHKCAYVPFGAGQRICVGQHMSMVDTVLALTMLLRELDVEYAGRGPVKWMTKLTFIPKGGLPVRVKPRA